jgi:hypothetical protein
MEKEVGRRGEKQTYFELYKASSLCKPGFPFALQGAKSRTPSIDVIQWADRNAFLFPTYTFIHSPIEIQGAAPTVLGPSL